MALPNGKRCSGGVLSFWSTKYGMLISSVSG